jgi:hypothetical protein
MPPWTQVINPQKRTCWVLSQQASPLYKHIRPGVISASQFSTNLSDAHGAFRKPASW